MIYFPTGDPGIAAGCDFCMLGWMRRRDLGGENEKGVMNEESAASLDFFYELLSVFYAYIYVYCTCIINFVCQN